MMGLISCIKHGAASGDTCFALNFENGPRVDAIGGDIVLECGEFAEYDASGRILSAREDAEGAEEMKAKISSFAAMETDKGAHKIGNAEVDAITEKMWSRIVTASEVIVRKMLISAPIIIRFHNDADGSGGAYSLHLSLKDLASKHRLSGNLVWLMHKGVTYGRSDAQNDILISNNYECMEKPLLILIDFGTSVESNEGIEELAGRLDIVWLDHHPIQDGFRGAELENYINPWQHGGDSNYTAGLLTSVLCRSFSDANTDIFRDASLIGDYSKYASGFGSDISALLDFITSDLQAVYGRSKTNVTPQEIEDVISNPAKARELLDYANIKLEEALDNGVKAVKRYSTANSNLCLLDFENVRSEDSKYPLPGRYASKLLGRLDEMGVKRALLVVNIGAYLLMRVDKDLCNDFDMLGLIEEMKRRYPDSIEGGGGHRCAGTIKLMDKAMSKDMTNSLISLIKSELE
ncbi:MAG: hypothetical protein ACYCO0_02850 [Candidatus Micrarchaeaceae archaeon]